jgi:CubicO group peptidase (beta-lactamase class C family)
MKYQLKQQVISLAALFGLSAMSLSLSAEELLQSRSTVTYQQQVEKLLQSLIDVTEVPAFSVAIVHRGELVASVAAGYADKELKQPATPEHLFRLASVSKVVGASMIAESVLDNKLDPDHPIGHYYPELNSRYHAITMRQLLAHTSGMPHYQLIDSVVGEDHYYSATAALSTLRDRHLLSSPGAKYEYSTHGYTLAGAILEQITKQKLQFNLPQYIKTLTGKPTPLVENVHKLHPMSSNLYERDGNTVKKVAFDDNSFSVFGAGLSATASDLAYVGAQVLKKSQSSASYQRLLFTPVKTNDGRLVMHEEKEQVGFGWRIGKTEQGKTIYHHAGVTFGARSVLIIYPELDLSIAFLSNSSWVSSIEKTANTLVELYLSDSQPEVISDGQVYNMLYQKESVKGQVKCANTICVLDNDKSKLSTWLQKFNPTSQQSSNWPLYAFRSENEQRLIMVTKIGFIDLTATLDSTTHQGEAGAGRPISFTLHHPSTSQVETEKI